MPIKPKKTVKGSTINRVGDAVAPHRRDPDIGKMIKEVKPLTKKPVSGKFAKGGTTRSPSRGK
jgi:hypothetical protein